MNEPGSDELLARVTDERDVDAKARAERERIAAEEARVQAMAPLDDEG